MASNDLDNFQRRVFVQRMKLSSKTKAGDRLKTYCIYIVPIYWYTECIAGTVVSDRTCVTCNVKSPQNHGKKDEKEHFLPFVLMRQLFPQAIPSF